MDRATPPVLLASLLFAACAGGPPRPASPAVPMPAASPRTTVHLAPAVQGGGNGDGYGPEILLPNPAAGDAEVARVGDLVLRQSQAFARLLSADPKLALSAVDLLVFDVLVARHAQQFGIRVPAERVQQVAEQQEQELARQVQAELGQQMPFGDYVWRIFGMPLDDWRRVNRLRAAQRLYQGYVLRYVALREDRVQVRYVVHKDRKLVEDIAQRVREGADFATLAMRHSDDGLRRDGGLLPAFGPGFPHPVAEVGLKLRKGELSPVFQKDVGGEARWFLVTCLDHLPGRDVPFAAVRAEIDADLEKHPLSPLETNAYTLRWRGESEAGRLPQDR